MRVIGGGPVRTPDGRRSPRLRAPVLGLVVGVALGLVVATAGGSADGAPAVVAASAAASASAAGADAAVGGLQLDPAEPDLQALDAAVGDRVRPVRVAACGGRRQGTAVLVGTNGVARWWTNRHVVAGAAAVEVGPTGTRPVVAAGAIDAAVLRADPGGGDGAALELGPRPAAGTRVVVVAFPDGRRAAAAGRVVATELRRDPVSGEPVTALVVDVPARPGSSGGAVLDPAGRVVGLVAAADDATGRTVALPMAEVVAAELRSGPSGC